jgi:polysaccharide pyruvyl transferase WcaK-like protein
LSADRRYVRIHGAFEVENFGDILLMRIFADWVRQAGWEPLVVDAPLYVRKELNLGAEATMEPKAVLMVGGGYLGEPNRKLPGRWRWGFTLMERHLSVLEYAKSRDLPYAVVGVGFGPISNLLARRKTRHLLKSAKLSVLRDSESADWAARYNVGIDAVSADAAIAISEAPLSSAAEAEYQRIRALAQGRSIVAVQFDRDAFAGDEWRMLFDSLTECLAGRNCFVLGVSDQAGTEVAGMHKRAAEAFLTGFPDSRFEPYTGIDALLGCLYASDLVITSKLHIGIVASAFGRSVLSLPTHQKTIRFYRQLGRAEICLPKADWTPASIAIAFEKAFRAADNNLPVPASLKAASLSNATHVAAFLDAVD